MTPISILKKVGTAFLALAGLFGTYLAIKGNKEVVPYYDLKNISVIDASTKNLDFKVAYKDTLLNEAGVLNLMFWNGGNETLIYADEVSDKYPFRLNFSPSTKVLSYQLLKQSKPYNSVKIKDGQSYLDFHFDFIKPNEGFVVKVVHSEINAENIQFKGEFKHSSIYKSHGKKPNYMIAGGLLVGYIFLFTMFMKAKYDTHEDKMSMFFSLILTGIILVVWQGWTLRSIITEVPPKHLEKVYQLK